MTLRSRLVLWFTGTTSVILLVFCGALLWLQPQVDMATLDEDLRHDVVTVAGGLATEAREVGPGSEAVKGMLDELHLPDRGIAVFDQAGALLGAKWNEFDAGDAMGLTPGRVGSWTYHLPDGDARLRVQSTIAADVPYRIAIAASLEEVVKEGVMLRRAVIVALPIALLLTALGAIVAARQAHDFLNPPNAPPDQHRRFLAHASPAL